MNGRPKRARAGAILLSITVLVSAAPFSAAESGAALPIGTLLASEQAMIGNAPAPAGTTVFAGDRVSSRERVLIGLENGGRIEMNGAAARLTRRDGRLVIHAGPGTVRFHFARGEDVQVDAGNYILTAVGKTRHLGELSLNRGGRITLEVREGAFTVLDRSTGMRAEAKPGRSLLLPAQGGTGAVSQDGQVITDRSLSLQPNELSSKCIVADREALPIASNTKDAITLEGSLKRKSGNTPYRVVDCTEEAMIRAGASEDAAKNAVTVDVFGSPQARESHAARNAAIIIGVGGAAAAIPLAIKAMEEDEDKSPSSR